MKNSELVERSINTIRFLSADGVQKANSGHPGLPMGNAAIAYSLWYNHLVFNPKNPKWVNRDRFILSGGHGSMLLYSLLHLFAFDLSLDALKAFRQWGSKTPGHPEYCLTSGVEATTGPLGQGFTNGIGMALAQEHLAQQFNKPEFEVLNHFIYAIVTDGDLMEGITAEAASFAGHQQLGKIVYLYDDNGISIDGPTSLTFTDDTEKRFLAYGWHVSHVLDSNNVQEIDEAIQLAQKDPRPSLIMCKTHIGYGLPNRQDTAKAHGEPPGVEELNSAKHNLGWPVEPTFFIPDDVAAHFRTAVDRGIRREEEWSALFLQYKKKYPELALEFERRMNKEFPKNFDTMFPFFETDDKGLATRSASGKTINAIADDLPELIGGSADLTPSNNTWINSSDAFQKNNRSGRNIHFGVREHAMGGIINGLALYGGLVPYGGTFLVFSDYMRPAIRLSALSHIQSIWVFTHDSIGLGEDGPTHQPVEHLAALRGIPNLNVIRPADANEVSEAWKTALLNRDGPTAIALSRQVLPVLDRNKFQPASGLHRGAYILSDLGSGSPDVILMASGSEVALIIEVGHCLANEGINTRLVSFPCWELFEKQDAKYKDALLPDNIFCRVAVEAGIGQGWHKYIGDKGVVLSIEGYGASAPYKELFFHYGFTSENIYHMVKDLLSNCR